MSAANNRGTGRDERRQALAQVQAEQQRAERRRNGIILAVAIVVSLALIIPVVVFLVRESQRSAAIDEALDDPIEGVVEYEPTSATHVQTDVTYEQTPPVGGDHNPVWQNCGFYTEPVLDENAVHSLEHGAVWIAYDPALADDDVDTLEALSRRHPYLLVSPYEGLEGDVVASAWGLQLPLDSVDDDRLQVFIRKYIQGPQTPEPGASCSGGIGQ